MEDEKLKAINADYNTLKIQNALMTEMLQEMKNANEQLSEANSKVV